MASWRTRVTLLGRLAIERDGDAARAVLPGRRAELVFAYLAAEHRRAVSRDELADALWPGVLPDTWAAALRGVVSEVRRFLEQGGLDAGETLVSASGGYQLRLPAWVVVDLDEARAALAEARERLSEGAAVAADRAERAAELARLPFLPNHEGDWVDGIRAELGQIHVTALELAVRARREAGDVRSAAAAAERLVRAEPYSEAAHRLRIELLDEAGDRAGAVRAYEHCRAVLAAELGIKPSAETQSLLERVLAAPVTPSTAAGTLAAYSVLVVEDHDFQRRTAAGVLRRLGIGTVLEASGGEAALELLAASPPPDVIIVDIDMPGIDGVELVRHVAERGFASAVVIASGLDRRLVQAVRVVAEGYGLRVLGAVEKPLTARKLSALLAGYRPRDGDAAPEAREGVDARRIVAHVQPIVDLGTGRLAFAEAVPHPAIEAREGLDDHLLALACDLDLPVAAAVPITGGPADAALADRLIEVVRARGGHPQRIVLMMDDRMLPSRALEAVTRLRAKGFGVWLDGFAGGSAALERFPLTGLRLAPRLVSGERVAALQEALDAALDLPVVGTGCDGPAELELLLQHGCAFAQGACVGETMPPRELARWKPPVVEV